MKFRLSIVVALVAMVLLSGGIFAKDGKLAITPFAGFMTNGSSSFTVGAIVDYPLEKGLFLEGDAGIVFENTWIYVNGGVMYQFDLKNSPIIPFVVGGGGIHYVSVDLGVLGSSSTTDFKLNAGGGIKFEISKGVMFRTEFRFYFLDGTFERISAGIEF
jgi:opacity protein-like surface antigen